MNIRQRITLLVVNALIALAGIGGFSVYLATQSARDVRAVTEGVVPSASRSIALMGQLKDVQIAVQDMVASADTAAVEQALLALAERKAVLQRSLEEQLASADTSAQQGLVQVAMEGLSSYFQAIEETARWKLAGRKELAEATLAGTVAVYLREQGESLQALQVEKTRRKDEAIDSLNGQLEHSKALLALLTAGGVVSLFTLGLLLYRQTVLPIGAMERKMTAIATTQDFSQRMPVARMDEVGRSMAAFNLMIERIQQSTALVREKTAEIQAMLHAIPQGILMIEAGGRIHPEYSDHLKVVLEQEDFAGRDVMQVLFEGTDLGRDALSQVEVAIAACVGEDAMNFEFNAHLLPTECEKTLPGGTVKVLDLHWAPMVDEASGTVTRLLLCVRDVTELRALARASDAQAWELKLIGEVLAVPPRKFDEFIESALGFVAQNRELIARGEADEPGRRDTVAVLFRNMHTIKGNARTHGLLLLAETVHRVEESYDRIRQGLAGWDGRQLALELDQVHAAIQEYQDVNDLKLGRGGAGGVPGDDGFVVVPAEQVTRLQHLLDHAAACPDFIHEARAEALRIGTERIEDALADVLESLPGLAAELGKEVPVATLHDHGIVLRTQAVPTLRNAFVHLYRNALDHGIEPAAQRLAAGKPAAGQIELQAQLDARALRLVLRDDGRGLALERIRDKGIAAGLLRADEPVSDVAVANLIFSSGFSTAERVSGVSGRGVGMEAVKAFIEAEGGTVAIELDAPRPGAGRGFAVVVTLPAGCGVRLQGTSAHTEAACSI
ncbi:ATP-binding protein [Azohydromonas australica]|uniref:ATP-binding protein n=1 Tax=Azohydromonas australica TaxID=364039 RepID=UPI000421367F|nr:ATP-binding protein [Azohydromonas australica]